MISYSGTNDCRRRLINLYFGDEEAGRCGICDNCLHAKSGELSAEEFNRFSALVFSKLETGNYSAAEMVGELRGLKKEKAWKIIEFLQAENKIVIDAQGRLRAR